MKAGRRKFLWAILLFAVLCSIVPLCLWYQVWHLHHVTEDTRRTMRAQGFKTDPEDFNVSTDATMQARITALSKVVNYPLSWTNDDAMELLPVVSNDIATIIWKQNSFKIWKQSPYYWKCEDWQPGSNVLHWADLHNIFDTNRWLLSVTAEAALSGHIHFDLLFNSTNFLEDPIMVDEWPVQYLSLTFSRLAMLELHDGNPDAAWTNLLAATRLVTASEPGPTLESQLLHLSMGGAAFADTWQVLQKGHWPDEKLAVLQHEWESVNSFTNLTETAVICHAIDVATCQDKTTKNAIDPFTFSELAYNALVRLSDAHEYIQNQTAHESYRVHGEIADEQGLMLAFEKRTHELRRAVQATNWLEMRALPGVTNAALYKSSYAPAMEAMANNHWLDNVLPAFVAEAEARRRVLITAIALERYHGKHGTYPASLAPLAPEFLAVVPMDFMDGQPLRYRLTDDGHFVLYSVGLNCIDDGGKTSDPSAPQWFQTILDHPGGPPNLDIVWPRPGP
jgi:hypothetical protein